MQYLKWTYWRLLISTNCTWLILMKQIHLRTIFPSSIRVTEFAPLTRRPDFESNSDLNEWREIVTRICWYIGEESIMWIKKRDESGFSLLLRIEVCSINLSGREGEIQHGLITHSLLKSWGRIDLNSSILLFPNKTFFKSHLRSNFSISQISASWIPSEEERL